MYCVGVEPSALLLRPPTDLLFQPQIMMNKDENVVVGVVIGRDNWSSLRKPSPVPLSTTHPTRLNPASNSDSRGVIPANSRQSYSTIQLQKWTMQSYRWARRTHAIFSCTIAGR
jgi:hypothetical protein